jgi:hypothetical protein
MRETFGLQPIQNIDRHPLGFIPFIDAVDDEPVA